MKIKPDYRGDLAEALRHKTGWTQQKLADFFGMTLNSWQKKEQNDTRVSVAEYHWLKLLLNEHPEYILLPRLQENRNQNDMEELAGIENLEIKILREQLQNALAENDKLKMDNSLK